MKNNKINLMLVFLSIMFFISGQKLCFAQKDGDDVVIGEYKIIHSQVIFENCCFVLFYYDCYKRNQNLNKPNTSS